MGHLNRRITVLLLNLTIGDSKILHFILKIRILTITTIVGDCHCVTVSVYDCRRATTIVKNMTIIFVKCEMYSISSKIL